MSQLIIFTDLDGTLLDHHTYSTAAADDTLNTLKRLQIPCVMNTSKTYAELEQLREELNHNDPFIVENGAAVYLPKAQFRTAPQGATEKHGYWCRAFGPSRSRMLEIIQELRDGFRFRAFSDMQVEEIVDLTGLNKDKARLAMQREFTEPLVWQDSPAALKQFAQELADLDLQVQRGGRFTHVMGLSDKAHAMTWLANVYATLRGETVTSMALGDGQNDVGMLSAADIAVVIRSPAHPPPEIPGRRDIQITERLGPAGWADAVTRALQESGYLQDRPKTAQ